MSKVAVRVQRPGPGRFFWQDQTPERDFLNQEGNEEKICLNSGFGRLRTY